MRKIILLIAIVLFIASCKKKDTTGPAPEKAVLISPAKDAMCTTAILPSTYGHVTFKWAASANTDSYELKIKNLLTGSTTTTLTTADSLEVYLVADTPFSWSVSSKSKTNSTVAQSDVWRFYFAGLGITLFPPFPAELVSPKYGQNLVAGTTTVNLTWIVSTIFEANITGYDVYFGTTATPPLFKNNVTNRFENNVAVKSGNTYYWKVITKDKNGNTSTSETYQFKVN